MNRIIFNHLKRWGWLWIIINVANGCLVGAMVGNESMSKASAVTMFSFVMWAGAMQLNFDLQRGLSRVQTTLPVTTRQIGAAWWIVSVALPAILLMATAATGMLLRSLHTHKEFPWENFALTAFTSTIYLGTMFFSFVGLIPVFPQNLAGWLRYSFSMICMFGMIFVPPNFSTTEGISVMLVGVVLTLAGWFRAEHFVVQRATFRPGIQLGKRTPGQYRAPSGFGGMPYLIQVLFLQFTRFAVIFTTMMLLLQLFQGKTLTFSPKQMFEAAFPAFSSFGVFFIFMTLLAPMVLQLRQLRTLPISASALAIFLVLLPVAPVLVVGIAYQVASGNFSMHSDFMPFPTNCLTFATTLALSVPFIVWRGLRVESLVVSMFLMMAPQLGPVLFRSLVIPHSVITLIALACIVLAIEITRRLLKSSSHAYRPPPVNMNAWSGWSNFSGGR